MFHMKSTITLLSLIAAYSTSHAAEHVHELASPGGNLQLTLRHTAEDGLRISRGQTQNLNILIYYLPDK